MLSISAVLVLQCLMSTCMLAAEMSEDPSAATSTAACCGYHPLWCEYGKMCIHHVISYCSVSVSVSVSASSGFASADTLTKTLSYTLASLLMLAVGEPRHAAVIARTGWCSTQLATIPQYVNMFAGRSTACGLLSDSGAPPACHIQSESIICSDGLRFYSIHSPTELMGPWQCCWWHLQVLFLVLYQLLVMQLCGPATERWQQLCWRCCAAAGMCRKMWWGQGVYWHSSGVCENLSLPSTPAACLHSMLHGMEES